MFSYINKYLVKKVTNGDFFAKNLHIWQKISNFAPQIELRNPGKPAESDASAGDMSEGSRCPIMRNTVSYYKGNQNQ